MAAGRCERTGDPLVPARAVRIRCDGGWSLCPQERTRYAHFEFCRCRRSFAARRTVNTVRSFVGPPKRSYDPDELLQNQFYRRYGLETSGDVGTQAN